MTAPQKTKLVRIGRAKALTRTSGPGIFPELTNPMERYS